MKTENVTVALIKQISKQLQSSYQDPTLCQQHAWWILIAITKQKKASLIAQKIIILSPKQQKTLDQWIEQLVNKKIPLQYLIGSVPFNNVEILVEPPILIPRPETEEWTLNLVDQLVQLEDKKITILDLCAGSGCIALVFAKHFPQATIYASDIANQAVHLIKRNAQHNNISNVTALHSDLFTLIPHGMLFDLIVSNPPYISPDEWKELDESVTIWEDPGALVAQREGLAVVEKIIVQTPSFIKQNGEMKEKNIPQLVLEIGHQQGTIAKQLMGQAGYNNILIQKDLEQKNRTISGRVDYVDITTS